MDTSIKLEIFEGPLDLLLHLIRKNEVDIHDIPVAAITRQYLEYLDLMLQMNISLAGDFMVMASTLIQIKTRLMLPLQPVENGEEEEDPRSELSQQLREHAARLKNAAQHLEARPRLDRDIFARGGAAAEMGALKASDELVRLGVFELVDAFQRLLRRRRVRQQTLQFKPLPRMSLEDKIDWLLPRLRQEKSLLFEECFERDGDKGAMVVTLLALLELARLGMINLYQERQDMADQAGEWSAIRVHFRGLEENPATPPQAADSKSLEL